MRVAVLLSENIWEIKAQMDLASPYADLFELRLDALSVLDLSVIKQIMSESSKPLIFTLRRKDLGGFFRGSEEERILTLSKCLLLKPDYVDLEYDLSIQVIEDLRNCSRETQVIGSYHNLNYTPSDLSDIYERMKQKPFDHIKIVTTATSSLDVLSLMGFLKREKKKNLSCMCIGKRGDISRILAKACGSEMVYGYVGEKKITGQISLEALHSLYHIPSGKDERKLFALIGEPLEQSIGHVFHNNAFQKEGLYVKIPISKEELKPFFALEDRNVLFCGFSVTTPLKEVVIPYMDEISPAAERASSVNTISYDHGVRKGDNTDGLGAMDAVETKMPIRFKTLAIIGTGPTARSIALEAKKRGAYVTLFSRDPVNAKKKFHHIDFQIEELSSLDSTREFDLFIDATGTGIGNIPPSYEEENVPICKVYMHLSLPSRETYLYGIVQNKNSLWISAEDVFVCQANVQQTLWRDAGCQ